MARFLSARASLVLLVSIRAQTSSACVCVRARINEKMSTIIMPATAARSAQNIQTAHCTRMAAAAFGDQPHCRRPPTPTDRAERHFINIYSAKSMNGVCFGGGRPQTKCRHQTQRATNDPKRGVRKQTELGAKAFRTLIVYA